ncbi:MAG: hypothetical protein B7Z40_20970 [Bosea sp. 12-68-7]|nr:MAG: hypothetical protein B7Z40_20970 [Bosea sp. 12-68-7]OYX00983.1 MAG: hypothetical protein B7Z14_07460 [Bosea sp. 32-68-6]
MGAGTMSMESMQAMMTTMMPAPGDVVSTKAVESADRKMMHDMALPYTGNADVDFRTTMITHHQGAIDMTKVALALTNDETTKTLAAEIITDQEREISQKREWLSKNAPKAASLCGRTVASRCVIPGAALPLGIRPLLTTVRG